MLGVLIESGFLPDPEIVINLFRDNCSIGYRHLFSEIGIGWKSNPTEIRSTLNCKKVYKIKQY